MTHLLWNRSSPFSSRICNIDCTALAKGYGQKYRPSMLNHERAGFPFLCEKKSKISAQSLIKHFKTLLWKSRTFLFSKWRTTLLLLLCLDERSWKMTQPLWPWSWCFSQHQADRHPLWVAQHLAPTTADRESIQSHWHLELLFPKQQKQMDSQMSEMFDLCPGFWNYLLVRYLLGMPVSR